MKRLFTMLVAVLLTLSVEAGDRDNNTSPKVTNYKEVIKQVEYPKVSRTEGTEGLVLVKLLIDEKGSIEKTTFIQYPHPELKKAVEQILNKFEFVAAKDDNGNPTKGLVVLPIKFKLVI